jgi:isoprenylcysteine carboxyl methyltransferase (ICMT) family protein YpbQ
MNIRWLFSPDYFISSLGLLLILIGVVIRWSAVLTLKKYFTVDVKILEDHKLIRSGVFKYVRHPSYFGGIAQKSRQNPCQRGKLW